MTRSTKYTVLGFAAAGMGIAQLAAAQEAARLEEIVVTAQRREASLESVPVAVTAITGADLEQQGVTRLDDLSGAVPNVYIDTTDDLRETTITVRGITSDPNNPGVDPSVGVFVDGVYMSRPTTINTNLYDLERVEVVRGPQGALYGKNTIAGAVNFITRLPTSTPEAQVTVNAGNYSAVDVYAAASGPLGSDAVLGRISVSTQNRNGLVTNTYTGTKLDNVSEQAARLALLLKINDNVNLLLRGDKVRDRTHDGSADVLVNGQFAGTPYADASPWDRRVAEYRDNVENRDVEGGSIQLDATTDAGKLTSLTAYRHYTWYNLSDDGFVPFDFLASGIRENQKEWSEDLRWVSQVSGPLSYIVGGYYAHQTLDTISTAIVGPDLQIYPDEVTAQIFGDVTSESSAAYAQVHYDLSSAFSGEAGLRYSNERKTAGVSTVGDPYAVLLGTYPFRKLSRTDKEWTPTISLNYKVAPNSLVYASVARGFKAGGWNVFSITPTNDEAYSPEKVTSYELGSKSTLLGGRATVNLAAYYLDYRDLQVNQLFTINGVPKYTTSNAASAQSEGVEVEARALIATGLEGSLSYGYNDSHYRAYANATPSGDDYSGHALPLAARNTVTGGVDLHRPVTSSLELIAHADLTYRSGLYFDPSNAQVLSQGGYSLFNARMGIAHGSRWSVAVWGKNLGNKPYAVTRFYGSIVPGQVMQSLGLPRTYGVELRAGF